jgi:hypothetical protein
MSNVGRTIDKYIYFIIAESGDANLREIGVLTINDVGLASESKDVSVPQDAIKNMLTGQPSAPIKITGRFDNAAAVTCPATTEAHALSGSHTIFSAIANDGLPHTLQIRFGIRHNWAAGEPVFGLQRVSASGVGYTCTKYTTNGQDFAAEFDVMGQTAPAWGTAALTVGS